MEKKFDVHFIDTKNSYSCMVRINAFDESEAVKLARKRLTSEEKKHCKTIKVYEFSR